MIAFISYAREDIKQALKIFNELSKVPYVTPWLDEKNLLPGMDWEHEIMKALQECRFILLLLSKNSVSKVGYVQKELKEALNRMDSFPVGNIFAIPVRLDNCEINDMRLKKLNWVNLFNGWKEGIEKIKASFLKEHEKLNRESENLSRQFEEILIGSEFEELENYLHTKKNIVDTDLSGANFMNQNLKGLDFSGKDLSGANFVNANLEMANFRNSNLKGVNFERAFLTNADFENANIWGVNFWGAQLYDARNFDKIKDAKYANFFMTRGIPFNSIEFKRKFSTNDLPDYGSFLIFFRDKAKLSVVELNQTFKWINHKYFIGMLGSNWGKI